MQSDDVVWQIINYQFCSFKATLAKERTFCQNPYNVTGLCLRSACPLANSSYATIREIDGVCYLFIKTAERAHTPKHLWEKIKLPSNYTQALAIVTKELEHFPKYLEHRNKQRLTKIHQMIIRMRKLKLKARPKIVTTSTKVDKREIIRERKALKAAQIDKAIENELLERLKQVSETEIYNYPEKQYTKALSRSSGEKEMELELENENDIDKEIEDKEENYNQSDNNEDEDVNEDGEIDSEEDDEVFNQSLMDRNYNIEYVEDVEESEEEDDIEDIDMFPIKPLKKKSSDNKSSGKSVRFQEDNNKKRHAVKPVKSKVTTKKARVEIEYEDDTEDVRKSLQTIQQYNF